MQISPNQLEGRNDPSLQLGLREQNNTAPLPPQKPLPEKQQNATASSDSQSNSRARVYSSYSTKIVGAYQQAIRAYQESARFEEENGYGSAIGNIFRNNATGNERTLTNIIREEPENSTAWSDLGVLYHSQGQRDKVSAIYQILQGLDTAKADAFATHLRLHEKMLFTVV